jgi:hypothetical protein
MKWLEHFGDRVQQKRLARWQSEIGQRSVARNLGRQHRAEMDAKKIDRFLQDVRKATLLPAIGSDAVKLSSECDWHWRPDLWRVPLTTPWLTSVTSKTSLADQGTVYHDCPLAEVTLRQKRNSSEGDLSAFSLMVDILRFEGSFFSLALGLPQKVLEGLGQHNILAFEVHLGVETATASCMRLNIQHGPNTEQLVQEVAVNQTTQTIEFDLGYANFDEERLENAWIDLIFDAPAMNAFVIRDLVAFRTRRADF